MGYAAYNRGSKAISEQIDRELAARPAYWATIEYLSETRALITLTLHGEWSGAGTVECRRGGHEALYEQGYKVASLSAQSKGGFLDRYSVVKPNVA